MHQRFLVGTLMLSCLILVGMQYPPHGTDYDSYRCSGGLVSKGDRVRDVIEMCGDPFREDTLGRPPKQIFIYRFDQSRVYYFEFSNGILTRIYAVNCLYDDPDCE